VYAKYQE